MDRYNLRMTAEHVVRVLEQIATNLDAAGLANEAYLCRVSMRALKAALAGERPLPEDEPPEPADSSSSGTAVARMRFVPPRSG